MNIKTRVIIALAALLASHPSFAQLTSTKCEPFKDSQFYLSGPPMYMYTQNGFAFTYSCIDKRDINIPPVHYIVLTRADFQTLSSMGGKLATASQSQTSLNTSVKRHVTLPYNDPRLADIRRDFEERIKADAATFRAIIGE